MNIRNEKTEHSVQIASEKLFMAISHVGDYEGDKIGCIIEESLWNMLMAVMFALEDKTE